MSPRSYSLYILIYYSYKNIVGVTVIHEVPVLTETKKRALARRKNKAVAPDKVYALDTLRSNAEILSKCGGQAALVFRAILGNYWISDTKQRKRGFALSPVFVEAIGLPDRQRQRALKALEDGGYVVLERRPGCKTRIQLTGSGKRALVRSPR